MGTPRAARCLPCVSPVTLDEVAPDGRRPEAHKKPVTDRLKPKKVADSVFALRMREVEDLNDVRKKCVDIFMLEHQVRAVRARARVKAKEGPAPSTLAPAPAPARGVGRQSMTLPRRT